MQEWCQQTKVKQIIDGQQRVNEEVRGQSEGFDHFDGGGRSEGVGKNEGGGEAVAAGISLDGGGRYLKKINLLLRSGGE